MKNTFIGVNLIPQNEEERLLKLQEYEILDTPPEGAFNHIAAMAARMFNVPIALVALVDSERVWFKANVGMEDVENVSRGVSLCSLAILNDGPTVFPDAVNEPCLLANPLVTGNFGLRFYAGAPLRTSDGHNLGTLCIVDKQSREFSEADQKVLGQLASIVMDEIELRYLKRNAQVEATAKD
ncbi:GAF domain-containing protein [Pontibacter sp. FD36]|uniref:GAF domain-containing protein n=1 Tax=Pontibacter sp. FD36 TaxID=2789860 RepID=UPI0018AAB0ED|nr:GAF domain-containing protein [Pontibacter sp. FD36]MBF8963160.1 GAF domain-containing protein [Pontibacter sp. FD36]